MSKVAVLFLTGLALHAQFEKREIAKDLGVVYAVRTADVNADGKLDVVAITGSKVLWYENPTWQAHLISENSAPKDHVSIAAQDINGDGRLDFALAAEWQPRERATKGSLHWLEQLPGNQWRLHDVAKIPGAHRIRWADVDGDGAKDLIVLPLEGKAMVFYLPDWRTEAAAENLELAHNFFPEEMENEAGQEIVMASKRGVETLSRQHDGTWTRTLTGEGQPGEVVIGRVNRYRVAATIEAFHGDHLVVYEEPRPRLNPQGAPPVANYRSPLGTLWPRTQVDREVFGGHALGFADFDGDGSDELAFGWRGKQTGLGLLKRNPAGQWVRVAQLDGPELSAEDLTIADLDADGKPDIIACGRATQNVRIYFNRHTGAWKRHVVQSAEKSLTAVGVKLNGLAKGRGIVYGAGNATFLALPGQKPRKLYEGANIIHSAVLDVDGDGDEDFVGAQYAPGYLYWLEQPARPATEPWRFHLIEDYEKGGIHGIHGLWAHDVDGDGKLELIANSAQPMGKTPHSIIWLKPMARGTKWQKNVFADQDAPGLSHYMGAGDLNGDGRVDIAAAAKIGAKGNWVAWWEQPESRTGPWKKHLLSETEPGATNPAIGDFDGDGKADLLLSRGHGFGLALFRAPAFRAESVDTDIAGPHSLAVGDVDGDGDLDAVTCAKDSMTVALYRNNGQGRFTKEHLHENQAAYDIRLVDLDGDGDLDVLVAGQESRNVVWFANQGAPKQSN
ncbi:MAG: hypothetical protein OHK0021_16210 [Bryobacter sp.]